MHETQMTTAPATKTGSRSDATGFGLVLLGVLIVAAQGYGLWQAREFDTKQRDWEAGTAQRQRDNERLIEQLQKQEETAASEQTALQQTTVELNRHKGERDRSQAELARVQRELDLARQDLTKATSERDTSVLRANAAKTEQKLAEERITALATQETDHKTELSRLQAQRDQLSKSLADDQTASAKVAVGNLLLLLHLL